jgi:ferric-dicitrate binding protein FerR (iron transport regulator)
MLQRRIENDTRAETSVEDVDVSRGLMRGAVWRKAEGRRAGESGDLGMRTLRGKVAGFGARTLRGRNWNVRVAVCVGVVTLVLGGIGILARGGVAPRHDAVHVYATREDQRAIATLDDGTRITLAPQTTLRTLPFGASARTVILERGEVYFEVMHASGAPFVVRTGLATTQVLGTEFFMRYDPHDSRVRVAVADGKVRVANPMRGRSGVLLTTGQIVDVKDSTVHVSTTDDLAPGMEVGPGRIVFRDTPLATVLQTISRWYGYQFRYSDQTLGAQSVTITVSTRSSFEALAAIERVLAVNLKVVGDTVTLVPQPPVSGHGAPRIRTYDVWSHKQEVGR